MTRQFCGNIGQVSNQVNSVVMGLAGADRIFNLLDEEPETDDGYVTLVNAKKKMVNWSNAASVQISGHGSIRTARTAA